MTKRETYCTGRGLKVWAMAGLMLILVLSSGPASAAQIDITNCTDNDVGICSYNEPARNWPVKQQKKLKARSGTPAIYDTEHFTCKAKCYFRVQRNYKRGSSCSKSSYKQLNHGWGSGEYYLVGFEFAGETYKSSNLASACLSDQQ